MFAHQLQSVLKIEDDFQTIQQDNKKSIVRVKNGDLPLGAHDQERFRKAFIPTLIWYAAFQLDPWKIDDNDYVNAMQQIWNKVYGKTIPVKIEINDAVFKLVRIILNNRKAR